MNKIYKLHSVKDRLKKGILATTCATAALISGGLQAQTTPTYCASYAQYGYDTDIYGVVFASMTNTSNCSSGPSAGPGSMYSTLANQGVQYSNYTSPTLPAISVVTGVNYTLAVTVGDCGGYSDEAYIGVWIDWNQDGLFTGTGEQVWYSPLVSYQGSGTTVGPFNGITVPTTALAGNTRMRVVANEYNQATACNPQYGYYEGETEDYTINVTIAPACNGTPGTSTVVAPSGSLCAGQEIFLHTSPSNTTSSVNYTWQACTTGSVGSYSNLSGGGNSTYTTSIAGSTWYRLASSCQNGGSTAYSTPSQVMVAATVTNSVPYYEGFEEPQVQLGQGPNCSWNISTPGFCYYGNSGFGLTPNNGNGMAYMGSNVYTYGAGTQSYYFWSNGIQLNAGVTYSASMFYSGYDYTVTIAYGTTQTSNGLTNIAQQPNIGSNSYKQLADTFRVATSGIYYIAISGSTPYTYESFSFDDLSITAPCIYPNNAATTVLTGTTSVCLGSAVVLTASGANSYTWSPGGATTNTISVSPGNASAYSVSGTKNLSNCVLTQTTFVNVEPVPGVQILPSVSAICAGQTATLIAIGSGASSFTWSTGDSGPSAYTTTISPSQTTTYNLVGINSYGCTTTATQQITVNQPPSITIAGNTNICVGEPGTLLASGANTYTWSSPSSYLQTNPISPFTTIIGTTSYTVMGIDANGCSGSTTVDLTVNVCTGIQTNAAGITNLQVYPNPTSGVFTIELNNGLSKTIEVMDVTGRVILNSNTENDKMDVNINNLANGIYYVRVKSDNATEVLKIVKQ